MQRKLKNWTEKKDGNKNKEGTSKPYPKNPVLCIRQPKQVEQQVTPTIQVLMQKFNVGVKQAVVKRNILECVSAGEKLMLRL